MAPIRIKGIPLDRMVTQYNITFRPIFWMQTGTEVEVGKLGGQQKRLPASIILFPFYDPIKRIGNPTGVCGYIGLRKLLRGECCGSPLSRWDRRFALKLGSGARVGDVEKLEDELGAWISLGRESGCRSVKVPRVAVTS